MTFFSHYRLSNNLGGTDLPLMPFSIGPWRTAFLLLKGYPHAFFGTEAREVGNGFYWQARFKQESFGGSPTISGAVTFFSHYPQFTITRNR